MVEKLYHMKKRGSYEPRFFYFFFLHRISYEKKKRIWVAEGNLNDFYDLNLYGRKIIVN